MADNFQANPGAGGDTFAADDIAGVKYPRSKITIGSDGVDDGDVSASNPLPVEISDGTNPVGVKRLDVGLVNTDYGLVTNTIIHGETTAGGGSFVDVKVSPSGALQIGGAIDLPPDAATETTLSAINNKLPALTNTVPGPHDNAIPVRTIGQDNYVCSFADVGASLVTPDMTQLQLGTGMAVSQSGGNLVLTTGTTANSEFLARSVVSWNGAMLARYQTILSQRIANNNFFFLLADKVAENVTCTINSAVSITVAVPGHAFTSANVGQSMFVGGISGANGVPGRYAIASVVAGTSITFTVAGWPASGSCTVDLFGWNYVKSAYSGTTATNSSFDSQRKGWNSGDTTATINTTASPGHMAQIHIDGRDVYYADSLVATATTPNVTTRASRVTNIPDDDVELYVYLWAFNGSTAPASTTTWTVGFWAVEDFTNTPVYIAGNRQSGTQAPMPAQITSGTITTVSNLAAIAAGTNAIGDVGIQYRASATGGATPLSVLSPATPAATSVKASAGRLIGMVLVNSAASVRSVKFWNTAVGSVTLGTTSALFEIDIPPGGLLQMQWPGGIGFATAITYAVTGAKGLTDNTAITANDVSGVITYA